MPFGLVNAPSVFQLMISKLIQPMRGKIINYVDEIIIPSRNVDQGLAVLKEFLGLVRKTGLTLRLSKLVFMAEQVNFLGHQVTKDRAKPGPEKTNAVAEFPRPTNVTEVRRYLGLTGFFRKFVPRYAEIAKPLTNLLKTKDGPQEFNWNEQCEAGFQKLKTGLCNRPILEIYDPTAEHEVHTDASRIGLSAILMQQKGGAPVKPVAYFSRVCSAADQKYHSHELEVLAIIQTVEKFRMFLLGKKFRIVTDCDAVCRTKATTPMSSVIARWILKLTEYNYELIHRLAQKTTHVDALSRAPVGEAVVAE